MARTGGLAARSRRPAGPRRRRTARAVLDAAAVRASASGSLVSRGSRWSRPGCARWSSTGAATTRAPDDPFRGLYLTDEDVDRLLAGPHPRAAARRRGAPGRRAGRRRPSRLRALQEACGLTDLDVEILLAALVPDLDARFERLYGYLNDDVTRRRATIGLALEIGAARPTAAAARGRLGRGRAAAGSHLLVTVEEPDRPFLSRGLRVPDRVAAHLLGADDPDAALTDVLAEVTPTPGGLADDLGRVLAHGRRSGSSTCATTAGGPAPRSPPRRWRRPGYGVVGLDLRRLATRPAPEELVRIAGREALLRGCGIVAEPVEALTDAAADALRRLASAGRSGAARRRRQLGSRRGAARSRCRRSRPGSPPARPRAAVDRRHWATHADLRCLRRTCSWAPARSAAPSAGRGSPPPSTTGPSTATCSGAAPGRRTPPGSNASPAASSRASAGPTSCSPTPSPAQLRELAARARHREKVLTEWRMRPGGGRGHGVTALFAGDSGTGKTMSAEVIAGELGLDLYRSTSPRSSTSTSARPRRTSRRSSPRPRASTACCCSTRPTPSSASAARCATPTTATPTSRAPTCCSGMETFDGLAILSTNLRANIDEAFTRRLDCDHRLPDARPRSCGCSCGRAASPRRCRSATTSTSTSAPPRSS